MSAIPADLVIRRARDGDLPDMARVHLAAYPGFFASLEERIQSYREDPRIPLENRWVCFKGSRLVGVFNLYDSRMHRCGSVLSVGGIGGVAVAPEARRDRVAYYMMARAVEIMNQNGTPLSLLYPFRHSFYHHLGWGLIGKSLLYRFAPESLPNYEERASVVPVLTEPEREEVAGCYRDFAMRGNGLLERSDAVWMERVFKNSTCYAWRAPDSGQVEGYLTFEYRPYPIEVAFVSADLHVRDFVWLTDRARRGLLGFLAAQRDQVKVVHLPDHANLKLESILTEPRSPGGTHDWVIGVETAKFGVGLMGRVIQLRRALATGGLGSAKGKITLKITDELNPANCEPLTVDFSGDKVEFPSRPSGSPTLTTGISTFSMIYWGALSIRDALAYRLIEIEGEGDPAFLDTVFAVSKPCCLDHF